MLPKQGKPVIMVPVSQGTAAKLGQLTAHMQERRRKLVTGILELMMELFTLADVPKHHVPDSQVMGTVIRRLDELLDEVGV